MILETLSAHFSIQIEGRMLAGVDIKRPNGALALATAAVIYSFVYICPYADMFHRLNVLSIWCQRA
jgi:hypothetical protein